MGSGFISRSDDVPDLMPPSGPAGTLVPTRANEVRERLAVGAEYTDSTSWPVDQWARGQGRDTEQQGRWSLPVRVARDRRQQVRPCPLANLPACQLCICLPTCHHASVPPSASPRLSTRSSPLSHHLYSPLPNSYYPLPTPYFPPPYPLTPSPSSTRSPCRGRGGRLGDERRRPGRKRRSGRAQSSR